MVDEFGKYTPEEAQEEASRLREKIVSGEASNYDEAEQQVEAESPIALPKTITQNHFWEAISGGDYSEPSDEQIEDICIEKMEQNAPYITELNEDERRKVGQVFTDTLFKSINLGIGAKRSLIYFARNHQLCYFDGSRIDSGVEFPHWLRQIGLWSRNPAFYEYKPENDLDREPGNIYEKNIDLPNARKFAQRFGVSTKPISSSQAISLLSDPLIWAEATLVHSGEQPLTRQGIRSVAEYGYSKDRIHEAFGMIRQSTGHDKLRILDVGGGSGYALEGFKKADPNTETINITLEEEPSHFNSDKLLLLPAEMLPAEFEETVDFAVSRTAFRYFTYPDIALRNIVKSLCVGGCADIDFSTERSRLRDISENYEQSGEELNDRVRSVLSWLKNLEDAGFIETNIPDEDPTKHEKEYSRTQEGCSLNYGKYYRDTGGLFKIKKLKSIKDAEH